MKKLLLILLALAMCVSMCACGSENNTSDTNNTSKNDGSIELTLENYEKYLTLDMTCYGSGSAYSLSSGPSYAGMPLYYKTITANIDCKAVSENFNYNDIEITVHISGTYTAYEFTSESNKDSQKCGYDKDVTFSLNIAGEYNGKTIVANVPEGYVTPAQQLGNSIVVTNISGTVRPA